MSSLGVVCSFVMSSCRLLFRFSWSLVLLFFTTELGASLSDLRIYNGIGDISLFTTLVWHSILSCNGVLGGNSGIQNDQVYTHFIPWVVYPFFCSICSRYLLLRQIFFELLFHNIFINKTISHSPWLGMARCLLLYFRSEDLFPRVILLVGYGPRTLPQTPLGRHTDTSTVF